MFSFKRDTIIEQKHNNFFTSTFTPDESYTSADLKTAIAVDKTNGVLGLQDAYGTCYYFDGAGIISSDIVIHESDMKKAHSFFRAWRRYAFGRLLGGKEIGILAAHTTPVEFRRGIDALALKVRVNDLQVPIFTILFLDAASSQKVQDGALHDAEYWDSMVKTIAHR